PAVTRGRPSDPSAWSGRSAPVAGSSTAGVDPPITARGRLSARGIHRITVLTPCDGGDGGLFFFPFGDAPASKGAASTPPSTPPSAERSIPTSFHSPWPSRTHAVRPARLPSQAPPKSRTPSSLAKNGPSFANVRSIRGARSGSAPA